MFSLLSVIVLWTTSSGIFSTTATDKFFRQRKGLIKKTIFQASAYNDIAEPTGLLSVSLYFICMEEFSLGELIKGIKSPKVLPTRNQEYTFRSRWNWIQGAAKTEMLLPFRWLWYVTFISPITSSMFSKKLSKQVRKINISYQTVPCSENCSFTASESVLKLLKETVIRSCLLTLRLETLVYHLK